MWYNYLIKTDFENKDQMFFACLFVAALSN